MREIKKFMVFLAGCAYASCCWAAALWGTLPLPEGESSDVRRVLWLPVIFGGVVIAFFVLHWFSENWDKE